MNPGRLTVAATFLIVSACTEPDPVGLSPRDSSGPRASVSASDCPAPQWLRPNSFVASTAFSYLWYLDADCLYHQMEIRNAETDSQVFNGDVDVYYEAPATWVTPSSWISFTPTAGGTYRWRVQSGHSWGGDGPWSAYETYAYLVTPISDAEIYNRNPRLWWSESPGAASYRIYRQIGPNGTPGVWNTVTTTEYVDGSTMVLPYSGGPNFVRYWVVPVSRTGIEGAAWTYHDFTPDGLPPE